ncbi:MAG: ANTAR domain-containing response regulator [Eubacterium sp.]
MKSIIIAYPVRDVALQLRSLLERDGLYVSHICALGSSVLSIAQDLREGVVICASQLSDMSAGIVAENLPPYFDVVALSKNGRESYMGNLINLALPLNRDEFLHTVEVLAYSKSAFTMRKDDEQELISNAKLILMNRQNISETQAHKYLQNESMHTGKKLVDVAKKIINEFTE